MVRRHRNSGDGPLRVFYVCSSLAIAGQNRASLLKALDAPRDRERAGTDVDRLTLIPNRTLDQDVPLHLLTLTPDTSLPDRAGKRRDGKAEERALIHNMIEQWYPNLHRDLGRRNWLKRQATSSWEYWVAHTRTQPRPGLCAAFFQAVRRQLGLRKGQHLPKALGNRIVRDPLDAIQLLRIALARAGLEQLAPDLVIFDEFQRFSDLLRGDDRGSDIAREMVGSAGKGPAVLLLSPTPFRLFGGEFETAFDGQTHHDQFFSLMEWLYGGPGDARATRKRRELEGGFAEYARGLRSATPLGPQTVQAKLDIERRLRPIMARTERFGHDLGQQATKKVAIRAPLDPSDLVVFRHQVECFEGGRDRKSAGERVGAAIQYWTSVPLPMQTLGPRYVPWKESAKLPPPTPGLYVRRRESKHFGGPATWAHPRLRALQERFPAERLAIPWTRPSLPWWDLAGPWRHAAPEKVLLFSRFRATPRAVAALLSYDVERLLLQGGDTVYGKVSEKTPLGPSRENLAFFHPCLPLIQMVDPATYPTGSRRQLVANARADLEGALKKLGVRVSRQAGSARSLPELIVALERRAGSWAASVDAWTGLARELSRADVAGEKSLEAVIGEWNNATPSPLESLNREELKTLTTAALSSCGVVVGRSLARHGLGRGQLLHLLRVSWSGLRSYLNNPWMDACLRRGQPEGRGYRECIQDAVLDGNLESTLDEHLWVTRTLRGVTAVELALGLKDALSLRTSNLVFHGLGTESEFRLRAHAVLPFTTDVQEHRAGKPERSASARQDELRGAFNSPFWPHVLASTSVGQEGLDFHAWCAQVGHWDLPGNPVDLEQREGRVDRYGGLSVRRALAVRLGRRILAPGASPWQDLAERAEVAFADDEAGLAPWWVFDGAVVERLIFDVPLSEAHQHLERLEKQRLLYRLALGQPDQEDLVATLQGRVTAEEARAATLVLSPWRYE